MEEFTDLEIAENTKHIAEYLLTKFNVKRGDMNIKKNEQVKRDIINNIEELLKLNATRKFEHTQTTQYLINDDDYTDLLARVGEIIPDKLTLSNRGDLLKLIPKVGGSKRKSKRIKSKRTKSRRHKRSYRK